MLSAGHLVAKAGVEKELKVNVRKLKNLGLTISHQPDMSFRRVVRNFYDGPPKGYDKRLESTG